MFLLVHVHDIVITGTSASLIENVIQSTIVEFKLKDLGSLNYFLGMEVWISEDYFLLNQRKYVQDLISKVVLCEASSFPTPLTGTCISRSGMENYTELFCDESLDRSTIGVLQHIFVSITNSHFTDILYWSLESCCAHTLIP